MYAMLKNSDEGTLKEKLGGSGKGKAVGFYVPVPDQDGAFTMVTRLELEPGASVGYHTHSDNEEVYAVLCGEGVYTEDGEKIPVKPGDVMLCRKGHSHAIENTGKETLKFFAAIAKRG